MVFLRSRSRSDFSVFASLTKVKILPWRSATARRLRPGTGARSRGSANFNLGKATAARNGAGGSGEPLTREVVHGTRFSMPTGWAASFLAEEAARVLYSKPPAPTDRNARKRQGVR